MSDFGWIKLHRVLISWEWFKTPNMVHFWIYCLLKANHEEIKWQGVTIKKGQFIAGRNTLAYETGLGEQTIRTCIEKLKSTNELTSKSTNKYTVFTINSWKKYQLDETTNQQINQQLTSNQPATNQQLTTNNNDKNEKNDKNDKKEEFASLFSFDGFLENWENWIDYRKKKKKPILPISEKSLLRKLEKFGPEKSIAAIEKSIANGWQGLFPENEGVSNHYPSVNNRLQAKETAKYSSLEIIEQVEHARMSLNGKISMADLDRRWLEKVAKCNSVEKVQNLEKEIFGK